MPVNENICPICQQQNSCKADKEQACWCNDVVVPHALIALIPKELQGKQCICKKCIKQFELLT